VCTSRREEPNRAASVCDGVPERADQQANRKRRGQADGKRGGSMEDARGYNAILTDEGFARLEEAWPTIWSLCAAICWATCQDGT
jgi:hypothetical protein